MISETLDRIKEFLSTNYSDIEFVDFEICDESSDNFDVCEIYVNLPTEQLVSELKAYGIDVNKAIIDTSCNEIFNSINNAIMNKISDGAVKIYQNVDTNGIEQLREMLYVIASDTGEHPNNVIIIVPTLSWLCHTKQKFSLLAKHGIFNFNTEDNKEFNATFYIDSNCCGDPYNVIFVNYTDAIKLNIGKIEQVSSNNGNSQIFRVAYQIDLGDISISKAHINVS